MLINKAKILIWTAIYAIIRPEDALAVTLVLGNPIKAGTFGQVVEKLAELLVKIGVPIAAIFLVWAGLLFVMARGDDKKIIAAKSTFYWTVLGTALIVGAYAIAKAIVGFAEKL